VKLTDALGRTHSFEAAPRRVVSLVPSLTETFFALGCAQALVGVTDYCVHPEQGVAALPKVGGTKNPRVDDILALRPDLIIANKEENRRRTVEDLEAGGARVFVTYARSVHAAVEEIGTLGQLMGAEATASLIVERIEEAWVVARSRLREPRPSFAALIWKSPYMAVGDDTFAHALLAESGGANAFAASQGRYPRVEEADLVTADPDIILLPTEPYAFAEPDRLELARLDCKAARDGRIHIVEGELLSWYGPRIGSALELFSSLFALE
jgi:ABC-type Fe3+-hydroxamate transport system substrate-binding protein